MPLPVTTHDMQTWAFLTGAINEVDPAASFLTQLLFPNEQLLPTEVVELSYRDGARKLAPFVHINGQAKIVPGRGATFANVATPNIALQRPMEAYESLLRRMPGTPVFVGSDNVMQAYRDAIAEDVQIMSDLITNRTEWMCAQMGTYCKITYTPSAPDQEQDIFDVTVPRPAAFGGNTGNVLTGNFRWEHTSATEGTTSDPLEDFQNAKYVMAKKGHIPTMVVMGRRAAHGFMKHSKVRNILSTIGNINVGSITFQEQYTAQGALLLTRDFAGLPVWEYSRTYTDDAGNEQFFLDQDAVLFISATGVANNVIYYGAIPDHDAIENGTLMTKRFSKSWKIPSPSSRMQLAQTRPLPFTRRPSGIYTLIPTAA